MANGERNDEADREHRPGAPGGEQQGGDAELHGECGHDTARRCEVDEPGGEGDGQHQVCVEVAVFDGQSGDEPGERQERSGGTGDGNQACARALDDGCRDRPHPERGGRKQQHPHRADAREIVGEQCRGVAGRAARGGAEGEQRGGQGHGILGGSESDSMPLNDQAREVKVVIRVAVERPRQRRSTRKHLRDRERADPGRAAQQCRNPHRHSMPPR